MERRNFISNATYSIVGVSLLGMYACKKNNSEAQSTADQNTIISKTAPTLKLSLAQWSLHKMIVNNTLNPMDFAQKAKELGFEALEYVSQLYIPEIKKRGNTDQAILDIVTELKEKSDALGMHNQIMMVDLHDEQALLASGSETHRSKAVENHKIWVDATAILGCHSMRVSLFGSLEEAIWASSSVKSLSELCQYAAKMNINVIVENHGYLSSNAALVAKVIKEVNMSNCGTLPDFDNFCLKREGNELWSTPCIEEYDKYKGVQELMPYAKGVSAKSFNFDNKGQETTIDFLKMMRIVNDAGYKGYVGIEYEGDELSEEQGILATKALLMQVTKELTS